MVIEDFFIKIISSGSVLITVFVLSFFFLFITKSADSYIKFFKKYGLYLIFAFSFIATSGSFLMSAFFELPPCVLCWYQRMFMYPIFFVSGFAIYKKDYKNGSLYSFMLATVGLFVALYHYLLQISESFKNSPLFCSPNSTIDCSVPEFVEYGFITTPFISLSIFVLIIISAYYASRHD